MITTRTHILLTLILFLSAPLSILAHDFSAPNADGVTIYYNKLSSDKCSVTYYGSSTYSAKYSGSVNIPSYVTYSGNTYSVTSIGSSAFYNCKSLTAIILPSSISSIGSSAFAHCESLSSISLPDYLSTIGSNAFTGCTDLTSISLPKSVSSIGDCAFYKCTDLTSITLPSSISAIACYAFSECTSLNSITILTTTPPTVEELIFEFVPLSSATLYVPYGAKEVYASADQWCNFGTILELLPDYFTVPNSDGVDIRYHKLSETECEVTSLEDDAKYSGSIIIPASVTYSGSTLSVSSIDDGAFSHCSSLTSISLPNSITSIHNEAFSCCTSLTSISLSNAIKHIGYCVFLGCRSLTTITLPCSTTFISVYAFDSCTSLSSLKVLANTPPTVESGAFEMVPLSSATLYVPSGTKQAYASTPGWRDFGTIIELEPAPTPLIHLSDTNFSFSSDLPDAHYHYTITSAGEADADQSIAIPTQLTLTVYATAEGYKPSPEASCTLEVAPASIYGDVNGDTEVNVADIIEIQNVILGIKWSLVKYGATAALPTTDDIDAATHTQEIHNQPERLSLTLDAADRRKCVWFAFPSQASCRLTDVIYEDESIIDWFKLETLGDFILYSFSDYRALSGTFTFVVE